MATAERQISVYCPAHKTAFEVRTAGRIVCASDQHALAADFPRDSFWEYCCDCRRFSPSELGRGGQAAAACAACQRAVARRYLCGRCKVVSVESDDAGNRRKEYEFTRGGAVGPGCPGCGGTTAGAAAHAHECGAALTGFVTARATCPFCEEPLGAASRVQAAGQGGIAFPATVEECLKQAAVRESKVVKPDPLKGILVKDPEGRGALILVHDWGVPGGILYLLPRAAYLQTPEDYYSRYEQFYDCPNPAAGSVRVVSPAVVRRTAGGWGLFKKGALEVVDAAPPPSRAAQAPRPRPAETPPPARETPPSAPAAPARPVAHTAPRRSETAQQPHAPSQPHAAQPQAAQPHAPAAVSAPPVSTYAEAHASDAHASDARSRRPPRGRRAAAATILALVAVTSVGLIIAAVASRGPSNANQTNANLNANGSASNSNAVASASPGADVPSPRTPEAYTPENPPPGMVYVSGGEFVMGSDADAYEQPRHKVSVGAFFIDEYEVTCAAYATFVAAAPHAPPPSWGGTACPPGAERLPVTGVSWADAVAYANWAGKRLPTEQEWEYAARGNDGRRYPWGDEWEQGAANVKGRAGQLAEVGSYRGPSPYNAYDMSGNAWEWTATDFAPYPGAAALKNPPSGKVIRGGCYASAPGQATTTYRGVWRPTGEETYEQTGFRCVMDVPASGQGQGQGIAPAASR